MKEMKVDAKVLADDVMIIAKGRRMLRQYTKALDQTHQYLQDMGAKVAPAKSYNFASTEVGRKWLSETWWKKINSSIEVVKDLRYLGGHLSTTTKMSRRTIEARCEAGLNQLARLKYVPAEDDDKAKAILNQVYAGMLYGVEGSDITESMTAKISAAVMDVYRSRNDIHDADWFYTAASNGSGKELDPVVQILTRRCMEFRRAICKRPGTMAKAQAIIASYVESRPDAHKWFVGPATEIKGNAHGYCKPQQHPSRGTGDTWKRQVDAKGPIGLLIQSVYRIGAKLTKDFTICKAMDTRRKHDGSSFSIPQGSCGRTRQKSQDRSRQRIEVLENNTKRD